MPYVICVEKDSEGQLVSNQKGLAERAHHPEEINAASNLAIDAEYYLTQQVRLLQHHGLHWIVHSKTEHRSQSLRHKAASD